MKLKVTNPRLIPRLVQFIDGAIVRMTLIKLDAEVLNNLAGPELTQIKI